MQEIPKQLNGSDCGVFACKFADFASRDARITFTQVSSARRLLWLEYRSDVQQNMPYFRERMVVEIMEKRLLS